MTPKQRFRPTLDGALESRIALSHAGGVAEVSTQALGLTLTAHGRSLTHLPGAPGAAETAHLNGSTRVAGLGGVQFVADLSTNPSILNATTTGTFHATVRGRFAGTLDASLSGPGTDLAPRTPTTTALNYTITSATGALSSLVDTSGVADLTLRAGPARRGVARGQFSLSLS